MNKNIKIFIEKNKNLIEEDGWTMFYEKARHTPEADLEQEEIGEMTRLFLDAGINPLEYMEYVPAYFLCSTSIKSFKIPPHIKAINGYAFEHCEYLEKIYIPDGISMIGVEAFYNCGSLTDILFGGTIEEWNAVGKAREWNDNVPDNCIIHCADGDIKIYG